MLVEISSDFFHPCGSFFYYKRTKEAIRSLSTPVRMVPKRPRRTSSVLVWKGRLRPYWTLGHLAYTIHPRCSSLVHPVPVNWNTLRGKIVFNMNCNILPFVNYQGRSRNLSIDSYRQTVRFTVYKLGIGAFDAILRLRVSAFGAILRWTYSLCLDWKSVV